ncbi:MAG: GNAT family N-acetyltransferase, partial [Mycobacteriales bacterium]
VVAAHLEREGLRAVAALDDQDRLVGIGYGYRGAPGQWWHDQVAAAMAPELRDTWLADAFEVCELHVRPALHGTGLGRDVLLTLLAGARSRTAVLTTPDTETRARRFYRAGGWVDLVRDLRFPGDPRRFAVLGLEL